VPSIGVLSYQGGYTRHLELLARLGYESVSVRSVEALESVDALIIPGGESTTIGMLMERFGLLDVLARRIDEGLPVFGTCAGAILLASGIEQSDQVRIGALDITVRRNAYGRQIHSFEADLQLARETDTRLPTGGQFHGVFIRAPLITRTGPGVTTLLEFEERPVLVRQGSLLASTFHPELSGDARIHRFFLAEVAGLLPAADRAHGSGAHTVRSQL
jgi:pyridoxal 5'-phosphate synthase pdxT subunit